MSSTIEEVRAAIASEATTATAVAEQHYARIAADDVPVSAGGKGIHSFLALSKERALAAGGEDRCDGREGRCAAAAGRRSGGHQGRAGDAGLAGDGGVEDSARLYAAVRCDRGEEAGGRGRGAAGQAELRRVCDGLVERELCVWAGAESAGAGPRAGRLERRHRRRRLRRSLRSRRWVPTPADRFASRRRSAAWWACCRRMGASRATG